MTKTQEIKLMIIENFIDYIRPNDPAENDRLKNLARNYVGEDHVDEIKQSLDIHEDDLGAHAICLNCSSSFDI
jgi:hypothetical protein